MSEAVAIIVGATISALVAVIVVAVQHTLQRRHEFLQERAGRLAAFNAAGHVLAVGIGDAARAPMTEKESLEDGMTASLGDRFNTALSAVLLQEDEPIVRVAFAMDRELVRLMVSARDRVWTRDEWRDELAILSHLVDKYQASARASLGARPLDGPPLWSDARSLTDGPIRP